MKDHFEEEVIECPACSSRHTDRSSEEKKILLSRLKRIEGQIRGLQGMVEKDAYCPDILVQVSAANSALNSFSKQLLSNHIHGCVKNDIMNGDEASIDELCQLLQRLMK
jgi:DNA-binding FrmR family transcriptional regulator